MLIGKSATILLNKVRGPLDLTDAAIAAASGLVQTPISIMNIANGVSNTGATDGTAPSGGKVKPKGW